MNTFGENIRTFREQMKWTQEKFADKVIELMQAYGKELNYTNRSISMWENGDRLPSLEVIMAVSDLTGCSIDDLLKTEIEEFRVEAEMVFNKPQEKPKSCVPSCVIEISNSKETYLIDSGGVLVPFTNMLARELFEELREWRFEEADVINLPTYCVFDDKTLNNIVNALPYKPCILWLIHGLKSVKIEKYGQKIVEIVNSFLSSHGISKVLHGSSAFTVNDRIESALGILGLTGYFSKNTAKSKNKKNTLEIDINKNCISKDSIMLTEFVSLFECRTIRQERQIKSAIMAWLIAEEFIEISKSEGGKQTRVASKKGIGYGLATQKRANSAGYAYHIILYNERAQRMIIENFEKIKELYESDKELSDKESAD